MLLIMISDHYNNHDKASEIYTGYFDSLEVRRHCRHGPLLSVTEGVALLAGTKKD